ncbi:MAG TPA: hydrolase [Armatimonadota bacterium]|nr:hydrolase [Armatimonadota bacterium]HPP74747.1 hydrolase [Armatimonadota bacterium]
MQNYLLERNDTVLVVVDIQEPFLRNIFERDRVVTNAIKLIEAAKVLGVPIVTTLQYKEKMGDVIPEVAEALPDDDERIDKMTFSCCTEQFNARLSQLGHNTVLLCGVETHVCLNQTALDLIQLGYKVQLAADAVSSRKESDYKIGLEKLRGAGVVITSTEAAIFELLRDAAAPEFRNILRIIK